MSCVKGRKMGCREGCTMEGGRCAFVACRRCVGGRSQGGVRDMCRLQRLKMWITGDQLQCGTRVGGCSA